MAFLVKCKACGWEGADAYCTVRSWLRTVQAGDKFGISGSKGERIDAWPPSLRVREVPDDRK